MKKSVVFLLLLLVAASAAAERKPARKAVRKQAASAADQAKRVAAGPARPATASVSIPPEAVQVDGNTYRVTDAEGRNWIYRRTPFGVSKSEERPPSAAEAAQAAKVIEMTRAVERGDEIEFERPGPFGAYRWQRKKADLNDMEKAVWERDRQKSTAGKPAQD